MMPTKLWNSFTAAPHRVMFFGGALQAIAVMLWWLCELVTRFGIVGHPASWPIVPSAAHAYLMIYGLFPFFMFGFLMTVFPRWMNGSGNSAATFRARLPVAVIWVPSGSTRACSATISC